MKTTFLLHGGRLKLKDERNNSYFRRLTEDLVDGDMVLHIPFARRTPTEQQEVFDLERTFILAQTNKKIKVVKGTKDDLIEQIGQSRAIHITGGQGPELVDELAQYPDFLPSLSGKTVGGSSAGAGLFSTYYWYGAQNEVLEGLGTLPIALFVHYGNPEYHATDAELDKFKPYAKDLELLTLEEAEWVTRAMQL